jgi:hypothetical protein
VLELMVALYDQVNHFVTLSCEESATGKKIGMVLSGSKEKHLASFNCYRDQSTMKNHLLTSFLISKGLLINAKKMSYLKSFMKMNASKLINQGSSLISDLETLLIILNE